jgi:carbamate kinase
VYAMRLDVCDASTQGEIGYLLQQSLHNELAAAGLHIPVVTVLTQAVVSSSDPALANPSKPVGPFYSREEAERRRKLHGWRIVEDAARGYRRIVPSPEPIEIVEEGIIRDLIHGGALVIAAGGGGIPVMREGQELRGVEAVIDKDRASAVLASHLGVDVFAISTDTDFVYLDYKKPSQRPLYSVTVSELEEHEREGQFPAGNMGPKIESALSFLRAGGREVVITCYERLCDAVLSGGGTHILPDSAYPPKKLEHLDHHEPALIGAGRGGH